MLDFPNAPTTNQTLVSGGKSWLFDGAKWQPNIAQYSNNVGRNLLHNPLFNIAQRGAGPWTIQGAFTADRWQILVGGGTCSVTIGAVSDAGRTAIGDEAAKSQLTAVVVGGTGATDETAFLQRVEGLRRVAGKTITISFWAAATSGTPKVGVLTYGFFGTGGSPSAAVLYSGTNVTISTTYARYSVTFAIPTSIGKTFGTNGDDNLGVQLSLSAGATNSANYGGLGVQNNTISFWGVQLEVGSTATPLEKPDPQQDLAKCQRFYQSYSGCQVGGYATAGATTIPMSTIPAMRATPTVTISGQAYNNSSTLNAFAASNQIITWSMTWTGSANAFCNFSFTVSADL